MTIGEMSDVATRASVIALSLICYCASLWADFVFDDTEAILNNKDVMTDTSVGRVFSNDFWGTNLTDKTSHKSYRPLTVFAYRLLRRWSALVSGGGGQPMAAFLFHSTNLMAYITLNLVLLSVLNRLFGLFSASDCKLISKSNKTNSFLITIIFCCHPIHCEVVSACVGLADLLSSLMVLAAIDVYIRGTANQNLHNYVNFSSNSLLITCMAAIAMLFKEQGIAAMGLCIIFDLMIILQMPKPKTMTRLLMYRILCLCVGSLLLLTLRLKIMNFKGPQFQRGDNPSSFEDSLYIRILNFNYIYAINAWILIFPDWLCFDWSMNCIALIKSLTDLRIVSIGLFWLILLLVVNTSLTHSNPMVKRQLQIGLAFLCVPFIPSANIFFYVGFVIAERALFLSSLGYVMIVITGFNLLQCRFKMCNKLVTLLIVYLALTFTIRTFRRSLDWVDETRLFQSGLDVCPSNAKIHYNIAKNAADIGLKEKAIREYQEAISLNPDYEHALNNLANILKDSGQLDEAKQMLLKAVETRPTFAAAWMNLGIVQTALKEYASAEKSYLNALKSRQKYADCYYNLGNLYVQQKRFDEAFVFWQKAIAIKPKLLPAWNNLVIMLDNTGKYEQAEQIAVQGLQHHQNESSLHFNYANVLGKMKRFEDSERHFRLAIDFEPQKANYYLNLGVLYHRWKLYTKALNNYRMALEIDPNLESAHKNLDMVLKIINN